MNQESRYFNIGSHQLHVRHISQNTGGQPVLMLHGSIENGRIFYNEKNKGLACYLASQGFDVYVLDFRGRGLSTPNIKDDFSHGYYECINEDIPATIAYVLGLTGRKMHVVCHSWGGVLFNSSYVRHPEIRDKVVSNICFGTKRQVTVWNIERVLKVSIFWHRLAPFLAKRFGYIDALKYGIGADSETYHSIAQSSTWVKPSPWRDPVDDFDYSANSKGLQWPPTWHLTGVNDAVLGHTQDVKLFIEETNPQAKFSELSKANGNSVDYDHINILTDKAAQTDHFPELVRWLHQH